MPLLPLREELSLLPGPVMADGQPSHVLHDPVRNLFFQIDWPTFEIMRRWHLGHAGAIAAAVKGQTTLQLDESEVDDVAIFFGENQLLQPPPGSAADMAARLAARRGSLWRRWLHNYLFFRVPLLKPDAWLDRWAPRVAPLYSRTFLLLTLVALVWGCVEVYRQWDGFAATLVDTLSGSGFVSYGVALVFAKFLHELGHAFTAKRFGCRVPTMGVAFLVLWPVAYTDTNEVWKLTERRRRLAVAAAGVLTELAMAAWATLIWALLPDGAARSIAFLLATTTWVSTLVINLSPFMRFDGYFLLSDALGVPNLHARAFALARWDLRERLFGLGAAAPEAFTPARRRGLIVFAYATWCYRLVVFLGIAFLVYSFFIKAVGLLLFAVEVAWFVLLPAWREIQAWRALWPLIRQRARTWRSAAIAAGLCMVMCLPLPSRPAASALLRPAQRFVVYAPPAAQIGALHVTEGQRVPAGALLLQLESPDLSSRLTAAQARVERWRWQAAASGLDEAQRAQWQSQQEQLAAAQAELAAIHSDAARYRPAAPFAGVVRDLSPELAPGLWVGEREALLRVVADDALTVVAYLDDDDVARIAVGDRAHFHADAPGGAVVALEVAGIDADASRTLAEPELATLSGGSVVVRERHGQLYPERPVYRVSFSVLDANAAARRHAWRGTVVVSGAWSVPGWRYVRHAAATLRREAGF